MSNVSGYREINVNLTPAKKASISMKQRLDRIMAIGVPTLVAVLSVGALAELAYSIKTHVWQKWVETVNNSTVQKSVMEGTYRHATSTDIIFDVMLGVLALTIVISCAYWAEAWYRMVKRGY